MKPAPVLLIAFNRPEQTAMCLEAIRAGGDRPLFVSMDAPRHGRQADETACREVRACIEEFARGRDVKVRAREANAGCAIHVPEAISWVLESVGEAIILEDDCLPHPSYFPFADELLERYRDVPSVAQISGSNFQMGHRRGDASYYFSGLPAIWGWATWERAWKHFDPGMYQWEKLRRTEWLASRFPDPSHAHYWRMMFDDATRTRPGSLDSWAIPWTYCVWSRKLLTATPQANLIQNMGQVGGANTSGADHQNRTAVGEVSFPLRHPPAVCAIPEADAFAVEHFYFGSGTMERIFWKARLPISVAVVRRALGLLRSFKRR